MQKTLTDLIKAEGLMPPVRATAAPVGGIKYDTGKLRYDLLNPYAIEGTVRVLTKGGIKYTTILPDGTVVPGDHNWEKGMPWSKVFAAHDRHMAAIYRGEDYDRDDDCEGCRAGNCRNHTGELHIDCAACCLHFISAYYRMYPQGDDRFQVRRARPNVGLDIDDVLADFIGGWCDRWNVSGPEFWTFDKDMSDRFATMKATGELDAFYLSLRPKIAPRDLPFEPHCYITSRPVSSEVTTQWLVANGFPPKPVYTVGLGNSKAAVAKQAGVEIFVDDKYENFDELNKAGICTFLYSAPYNERYNVGFKRIKSLKELKM